MGAGVDPTLDEAIHEVAALLAAVYRRRARNPAGDAFKTTA
jgi:hypothetical protein